MRYPHIDVMTLCYDRIEYTRECLPRLLASTCYPDWTWWIVDNGSTDGTEEFLDDLAQRNLGLIRLLRYAENRGISYATAEIWSRTTGGYLAKIDNDILVPDGWLLDLHRCMERNQELDVAGCWVTTLDFAQLDREHRELVKSRDESCGYYPAEFVGGNYLMRREAVQKYGPPLRVGTRPNIWGWTLWQRRAVHAGAVIGYTRPVVRTENIDLPEHPLSRYDQFEAYRVEIGRTQRTA